MFSYITTLGNQEHLNDFLRSHNAEQEELGINNGRHFYLLYNPLNLDDYFFAIELLTDNGIKYDIYKEVNFRIYDPRTREINYDNCRDRGNSIAETIWYLDHH